MVDNKLLTLGIVGFVTELSTSVWYDLGWTTMSAYNMKDDMSNMAVLM